MFLRVVLGGLFGVMPGVVGVPARGVRMMGRLFVLAAFVMLRCLGVVACCMRMMFGRLFMMLSCFLGHSLFLHVARRYE